MDDVEHGETPPDASVAVAYTVVVVLSETEAVTAKEPVILATPVARTALVQLLFVYRRTVLPASATPLNAGELLLAGDTGDVEVSIGAEGGALSSTYDAKVLEQDDAFPAASVARA